MMHLFLPVYRLPLPPVHTSHCKAAVLHLMLRTSSYDQSAHSVTFSSASNQTNTNFLNTGSTILPSPSAKHECITRMFYSTCSASALVVMVTVLLHEVTLHPSWIQITDTTVTSRSNFINTHCMDTNSDHIVLFFVH